VTRDRWLEVQGWTVVRFWNSEVLGNLNMVLDTVAGQCYSSKKA
jgi:very-short-patch-repair endonuclease